MSIIPVFGHMAKRNPEKSYCNFLHHFVPVSLLCKALVALNLLSADVAFEKTCARPVFKSLPDSAKARSQESTARRRSTMQQVRATFKDRKTAVARHLGM